jgi:hypothetical protein
MSNSLFILPQQNPNLQFLAPNFLIIQIEDLSDTIIVMFSTASPPGMLRHCGSEDVDGCILFEPIHCHPPHTVGAGPWRRPIDPHIKRLRSGSPLEVTAEPSVAPNTAVEAPPHTPPSLQCRRSYDYLTMPRPAAHLQRHYSYCYLVGNDHGSLNRPWYAWLHGRVAEGHGGQVHHHKQHQKEHHHGGHWCCHEERW